MQIAVELRTGVEVVHRIDAQQIEGKAIRHNVLARHGAALLRRIELLVERIVFAHIFIERNSYRVLSYHDALVKSANLGIETRLLELRNPTVQTREGRFQLLVDVFHIGKFCLSIGDKRLQGRILIEHEETVADIGVGNGAKLEHFLYQRTGFYRVIGIHLLQGREITGSKISAFQSVVTLYRQGHSLSFLVRLELKLAGRTEKHDC